MLIRTFFVHLCIWLLCQALEGDVCGETAMTAVKNAIGNRRCDVVKQLADLGCDVNMTDTDGWYSTTYHSRTVTSAGDGPVRAPGL